MLPAWSSTMLSPALKVTVSPGLISSLLVPVTLPVVAAEVTVKPEALMALATLSAVAKLLPLASALTTPDFTGSALSVVVLTLKVISPLLIAAVVPVPSTKLITVLPLLIVSTVVPFTAVVNCCNALSAFVKLALVASFKSYCTLVVPLLSLVTVDTVPVPLRNCTVSVGVTTPFKSPTLSLILKPWLT